MLHRFLWEILSRVLKFATALVSILLVGGSMPTLYAQLSSASVTGVTRDSSGSVAPSVKLVLRNVDTSVERTVESNNAGNYLFTSVPPGRYTLQATAAG